MDYSDIVFDDLIKYPELTAKIFGSSSIDANLLKKIQTKSKPAEQNLVSTKPEQQQNNKNRIQENSNLNIKEEQVQLPQFEVKLEPKEFIATENGFRPVFYQPFPVIIDSFSILQTGLIFLAPGNVNSLQVSDPSNLPTQPVGSQQTKPSQLLDQQATSRNSENSEATSQQSKFKEGSRYCNLSPKQLERIREQDRIRKQRKRLTKTEEERKADRLRNNLIQRERRARETDEQRSKRLNQSLMYKRKKK